MTIDGTTFRLCALPNWYPAAAVTIAPYVWIKSRHLNTSHGEDILRHEAQHIRDQRKWHIFWWFSYILLLPIGPSFKAFWEWRAYKITLRAEFERTGRVSIQTMSNVARWLSGSLYLWAVPLFVAKRLVADEVKRLEGR